MYPAFAPLRHSSHPGMSSLPPVGRNLFWDPIEERCGWELCTRGRHHPNKYTRFSITEILYYPLFSIFMKLNSLLLNNSISPSVFLNALIASIVISGIISKQII